MAVMPNAPPVAPAQPAVTVRKGAYQAGARRPVQAPVQREEGMSMGEYDNPYGGVFGEAEQEADALTVDALGLSRTAATGEAPSAAAILGQQGLDRAASEQASLAASARGPAALAMAQQGAAYNTASLQQQGAAQMAANRAQEMDQARQQYLEGTGLLRSQRQGRLGMAQQQGTDQAGFQERNQQGAAQWDQQKAQTGMQIFGQGAQLGGLARQAAIEKEQAMAADAQGYAAGVAAKDERDTAARGKVFQGIAGALPGAANQLAGALGGPAAGGDKASGGATGKKDGSQDGV